MDTRTGPLALIVDGAEWPGRPSREPISGTPKLPPGGGMTAEALSAAAADGSPQSATDDGEVEE